MVSDDSDSIPTLDDGILAELLQTGSLGPFSVSDSGGRTHRGLVRDHNEDALSFGRDIFVVADGMGGYHSGEVAAAAAVDAFAGVDKPDDELALKQLVYRANSSVLAAATAFDTPRMGTTLVAIICHPTHILVTNVGDSRCYRLRDGGLEVLTCDHNIRTQMLDAGVPLERLADAGIRLDLLTSYLGASNGEVPSVFVATYSIRSGDRYLLCSDGVHSHVDHQTMIDALQASNCSSAADSLIQASLATGGLDNATAIVLEMEVCER